MNTTVMQATDRPAAGLLRTVLGVFKMRIGVLIMITALGGMAIASGPGLSLAQVLVLALSVLVASASAGAFNQYVEADSDRLMVRTRRRAFASGALKPTPLWLLAIGALLAGAVACGGRRAQCHVGAVHLSRRLLLRRGLHDVAEAAHLAEHRRRRAVRQLRGAGRGRGGGPDAWARCRCCWRWCCSCGRRRTSGAWPSPTTRTMPPPACRCCRWWWGPRARRASSMPTRVLLVAVSLLPLFFGAGWIYGLGALAGGAHFVRKAHALARAPGRGTAMASFFASMVQLSVLLAAVAVDAALR